MPKNQQERLYFIVRSYLMGLIGGVIFPVFALILGSINFIQTILIGFFVFIASLAVSRLFEPQINKSTKVILKYLNKQKPIKNFILKHF